MNVEIIPAWLIKKLEEEKQKQQDNREQLHIHIDDYPLRERPSEELEKESVIYIPLR